MKRLVAATVLASLSVLGMSQAGHGTAVPPADCQEDQDCWDCSTMGNRLCGPTNHTGWLAIDSHGTLVLMTTPWGLLPGHEWVR